MGRLHEALVAVAREAGLGPSPVEVPAPPADQVEQSVILQWMDGVAQGLGLEAEVVHVPYGRAGEMLRRVGPALVTWRDGAASGCLALVRGRRWGRVELVGPDLRRRVVSAGVLRRAICLQAERAIAPDLDLLLDAAGVQPGPRRERSLRALFRQRLASRPVGNCWMLRHAPHRGFWRRVRRGPARHLAQLAGLSLASYGVLLLSWWLVGRGALQGRMEPAWMLAWLLMLLTLVPMEVAGRWLRGLLAVESGALLKQRLLSGALRLEPDDTRHEGVGLLYGRVVESEAVEHLAIAGGFAVVVSGVELLAAGWVLAHGAAGGLHVLSLAVWTALALGLAWAYYRRRDRWTDLRLAMTNRMVEGMVGHRTRVAQQAPSRWHLGEDDDLDRYQRQSRSLDTLAAVIPSVLPRGWMLLALAGLAPVLLSGPVAAQSTVSLAVSIGGILLANQALTGLAQGVISLMGASISWRRVRPLFQAAERAPLPGFAVGSLARASADTHTDPERVPVMRVHDVRFRYPGRGQPVLDRCDLELDRGERVLLEGVSGSGKSTLAALLTGTRRPDSGSLLLHGLDRFTWGDDLWRQRVASAPQFHENHVFTATFAFNALMGRRWPPTPGDMQALAGLCQELGLGPLLQRMPGGMNQMVGETGWQLSHGERSRLYIARALLQRADLLVLDESFAALDPQNLERALRCVLARAPAMVVIAHP